MKLHEFVERFGALSEEAFLLNFEHPFLLEEGKLELEERERGDRRVYLLRDRGSPVRIGRSASADLRVRHEQVSNRHALAFPPPEIGGTWQLMDANSTNGTFLDGEKAPTGERVALKDGTLVRFGITCRLVFLHPRAFYRTLKKFEKVERRKTGRLPLQDPDHDALEGSTRHDFLKPDLSDEEDAATPSGSGDDELLLVCEPFDPVRLEVDQPITIGRTAQSGVDLVLPHPHISRRHCEIERRADGVYVRDFGSANGTFILQIRVGMSPIMWLPGKPLTAGPFTLHLSGPAADTPRDHTKTQEVSQDSLDLGLVRGELSRTPVVDILQEIEDEEKTGVLMVSGDRVSGEVVFRQGEPYRARTSSGEEDVPAVLELLSLDEGRFELDLDESRVKGQRRITLSFGEILLDDFLLKEG